MAYKTKKPSHYFEKGCIKYNRGIYERRRIKKDQLPQILHVKDLQVLLSISHNTAYELVRSGKIRSIRIGRTYKIPLDAFNEYLRNG